jgi:hypothetical protein
VSRGSRPPPACIGYLLTPKLLCTCSVDAPLDASKVCQLANPHSNAFVDLDGDCLADIFLHCKDAYTGDATYQIWLNRKEKGYVLAKEGRLPKGAGQVTFADMGQLSLCRFHFADQAEILVPLLRS